MLWQQFKKDPCRKGHDIIGPNLAMGGWFVYQCTRCPFRFRADRVIQWRLEK